MASGAISCWLETQQSSNVVARIVWSSTPNPENNTSRVSASLQARTTSGTFSGSAEIGLASSFSNPGNKMWVPAKSVYATVSLSLNTSWKTLANISYTVAHSSEGYGMAHLGGFVRGTYSGTMMDVAVGTNGYLVSVSLDRIQQGANITSAPNFTDEENPTITYSNPGGSNTTSIQACISLTGGVDDIPYRPLELTGTSYTFELTDAERELLRNATNDGSPTRKVRFYVKSEANGTTYFKYLERDFTVINASPSIHATYYDVNENTVKLTGNSDVFILGYSDCQFQVEATPKKGATIVGYNTFCGSKSSTLQKSTFYWVEDDKITFTATDSRGQTALLTLPLETIEYLPMTCDIEVGELTIDEAGEATASAPVKITGDYFNGSFGAEGLANELKIELIHTGTNDVWVELTDGLVPIVEDNKYTLEVMVRGLDYKKQLVFQARASDRVGSATSLERTIKLIPVFDWGESDFNFNVPVSFQGDVMADMVIEEGTDAMGSNGTWHWQKWKNGKAECWGVRNYGNMAVSNAWGNGGYYSSYFSQEFPDIFSEAPSFVDITVQNTDSGYAWIARSGKPTDSETGDFVVVRFSSGTVQQVYIAFHVIGRWKPIEETTE